MRREGEGKGVWGLRGERGAGEVGEVDDGDADVLFADGVDGEEATVADEGVGVLMPASLEVAEETDAGGGVVEDEHAVEELSVAAEGDHQTIAVEDLGVGVVDDVDAPVWEAAGKGL